MIFGSQPQELKIIIIIKQINKISWHTEKFHWNMTVDANFDLLWLYVIEFTFCVLIIYV